MIALAFFQLDLKFYNNSLSFSCKYFFLVYVLKTVVVPSLFLAAIFNIQLCCC